MQENIGDLHAGDRDLKFLLHFPQDPRGQIIAVPGRQVLQHFFAGIHDSSLLDAVDGDRDVDGEPRQGVVRQLPQPGIVHADQDIIDPGQNVVVEQGVDSAA